MNNIRFSPLPDTLFLVRVPIICTYSEEEIDIFGLPMSSDNLGNQFNDTFKDLTTVMINVDKMIDIYIQGYPIYILNKEDSITIFKILEDYLAGTVNNPVAFLNQAHIEENRLQDIERFAEEMFGLNKHTIVGKIISDNNSIGFGMDGFDLMPMKTPEQVINETVVSRGVTVKSTTLDPNVNLTPPVNRMPLNHTAYPYVPEPKIENNTVNSVKSYAYLYDTIPDVNIDISKVTRRPNYRKTYN